jgi:hypothetical protein
VSEIIVVCPTTGFFADDVHACCATCAAPIVHRPHVPPEAVTLCCRCAATRFAGDSNVTVVITEETRREVALYRAGTTGKH